MGGTYLKHGIRTLKWAGTLGEIQSGEVRRARAKNTYRYTCYAIHFICILESGESINEPGIDENWKRIELAQNTIDPY